MQYPLQLRFKVFALATQIYVTDASGNVVYYVKQKMFKLKEAITVFGDEAQQDPKFTINADRVIDFSASYAFTDTSGQALGAIKRQGMKSFWKATYEIRDEAGQPSMTITEENPWVKVLEGLLVDVPVVGMVANYLLNPKYAVTLADGRIAMRFIKMPSVFDRRFEIESVIPLDAANEKRAILGGLMMVLLERNRG
ncbi:MAG: hypothetical protein JWM80_6156 [Cyanobacteria bacterium RYN_339]|nr:hypothetical protein [Cyanobacteria bacterium RYN_339]